MTMRDLPCHCAAARPRFSATRRKDPTMRSEMAIIATATNDVRFATQMRRTASRRKYEKVLDGASGSCRAMKSRGIARRPRSSADSEEAFAALAVLDDARFL